MRPKLVEDDGDVLKVLRPRGTVDQNVIEKHQHKPAQVWAQDVVHQCLERRGGVGETERHHQKLVVAVVGAERRLGHVLRVHAHLVIARTQVELGEEARSVKFIEQLVHHRDGKLVLGSLGVKGAVVDAEMSRLVRLADEEHRRREW